MDYFKINISQLLGSRFDVLYNKSRGNYDNYIKLTSVASIRGGKRIPKGLTYSNEDTPYLYLRVTDISDGTIDYSSLKRIDEKLFSVLKRYEIKKGDIAMSIAGTIGKIVLIQKTPKENRIILTENCAKIQITDKSILPQYLALLLNSSVIQEQISLSYIQTTIPKLGLDKIANLLIPEIPSIDTQTKIIRLYENAYNLKTEREINAKKLLNSINPYLLKKTGIILPDDNHIESIFTANISSLIGCSFDVRNIQNKLNPTIINGIVSAPLKNIALIKKGQSITKSKVIDGPYPVIAGGQSSPYSHSEYNEEKGSITISASGAYSGFVSFHDYRIFASDCNVVRSNNEAKYLTKYIYEILKVKQEEIYKLQRGSGQPHVYASDLKEINIPLIKYEQQKEIVDCIGLIRNDANKLYELAHKDFEQAKEEIEKLIL